jgi:hypothetical protein
MLLNVAPEPDEVDLFLNHPHTDLANAAVPDLFYMEICRVP